MLSKNASLFSLWQLHWTTHTNTHTHTHAHTHTLGTAKTRAKHKKRGSRQLLGSCRAALDVFRSVEDGRSAKRVLSCKKQCNSLLPSPRPKSIL